MSRSVITRRITESAIREGRKAGVSEIRDTLIKGFSCMINQDASVISFIYRYRSKIEHKRPAVKVGRWPGVSADVARGIVTGWVAGIANGVEPHIKRQQQRQEAQETKEQGIVRVSFAEFADGPFRDHLLRNKLGGEDLKRLNRDFHDWRCSLLHELKKTDLVAWQIAQEKRGLAHSTIKRSFNVLRAMLNYAVELEVLDKNPLQGARLKRARADEVAGETEERRRRALAEHEVGALFRGLGQYTVERKRQRRHSRTKQAKQYLPDLEGRVYADHVVPFILCIYYGGFRPGDLFELRWEHVSSDFACIQKRLGKTSHHGRGVQRFVISEQLTEVLRTWWSEQGKPTTGYVFSSPRFPLGERRLSKSALRGPWRKVKHLGGLDPELDMYSLRHNFASQLVMAGVDLATVQELMGHASIETTIKHYGHLLDKHVREALRAVDSMEPSVGVT